MKKTLVVVDMQNDFIDGALGTKEAVAIVDNVKKKIAMYKENGDEIIFTRDTHQENYMETNEGKNLPVPHCIEGTKEAELVDEIKPLSVTIEIVFPRLSDSSFILAIIGFKRFVEFSGILILRNSVHLGSSFKS